MGTKKSSSKGKKGSVVSKVKSAIGSKLGLKAKSSGRRRRVTPEKLARQILIYKLKKKLYKMKYGGR